MKFYKRLGPGLKFVILIGVLSLFADFAYEGARSITGPFLGMLGASAAIVSIVAGLGEFLGCGVRLLAGPLAERTRRFWPIAIFGYVLQMTAVPLLAFAGNWPAAAALIVAERIGKGVRQPPKAVMLSHASKEIGYGWGFGIHEAMDQFGALAGPLLIAGMLALHRSYNEAFVVLAIPSAITVILVVVARLLYPRPQDLEPAREHPTSHDAFSPVFWLYLVGAGLVAAGFADYSLIAYHFQAKLHMSEWLPISYAIAMATSGAGSLLFGKLFDRFGLIVLVPLTIVAAAFAPLVFLGNFTLAVLGAAIWGLGMGVHESIVPAAVAHMVPQHRRASAYGIFTGVYGMAWFLGSIAIGLLYMKSLTAVVIFCVVAELVAIPIFIRVNQQLAR
ncbi:MAG TPA: MFS transporter [Candidatus Baltobacteraceae bacterium]|nr:MFS transporter [Candidatus Baltobacteraceae bacterium]